MIAEFLLTGAAGSGIDAGQSLHVHGVTITLSAGGIGVAAGAKLALDGVTITGPVIGAIGGTSTKIVDSTISAVAFGVSSGAGSEGGGPCEKGALVLRRSSVTGASSSYCVGADPPANCADLVSCKPPKLPQSTCGTSCQGGGGVPCRPWGVCAND